MVATRLQPCYGRHRRTSSLLLVIFCSNYQHITIPDGTVSFLRHRRRGHVEIFYYPVCACACRRVMHSVVSVCVCVLNASSVVCYVQRVVQTE